MLDLQDLLMFMDGRETEALFSELKDTFSTQDSSKRQPSCSNQFKEPETSTYREALYKLLTRSIKFERLEILPISMFCSSLCNLKIAFFLRHIAAAFFIFSD